MQRSGLMEPRTVVRQIVFRRNSTSVARGLRRFVCGKRGGMEEYMEKNTYGCMDAFEPYQDSTRGTFAIEIILVMYFVIR